ncbi:HET domain containing protein [Rhypophila sp. PSN 637]
MAGVQSRDLGEGNRSLIRISAPPIGMSKSSPIPECKNVEVPWDDISAGYSSPCLEVWMECASSGCHACRLAQLGAEYLSLAEPEYRVHLLGTYGARMMTVLWTGNVRYDPFPIDGLPMGDTIKERTVYLYTKVGAKPTSWPGIGVGRDIGGQNGQDPKDYASVVLEWLDTCLQGHPACRKNTSVSLPSRLLDVHSGQRENSIHLVSGLKGQAGSYTALSHCWGGTIDVRTTKDNISSHEAGIQFSDLPKNFQDAVTVTRAVGLRYLWIDALCIIQDDQTDWEVESGNMASIYQQAYFVIGANVSPNADGGFLDYGRKGFCCEGKAVGVVEEEQTVIYARSTGCHSDHGVDMMLGGSLHSRGPLGQRAWTLQESLLASRLVTFEEPEIVWKCTSATFCQCAYRDQQPALGGQPVFSLNALLAGPVWSPEGYMDWYRVVQEVAKRNITKASDMLPCLSGLARRFHDSGAGTYLAGLWLQDLPMGLLWSAGQYYHTGSTAITPYRGPSWSWTSIQHPFYGILFGDEWDRRSWEPGMKLYRIHIELLRADCKPKGKDPFGEVSVGCSITVAAPLMELWVHPGFEDNEDPVWVVRSISEEHCIVTSYSWFYLYFDSRKYKQLRGAKVGKGTGGPWCLFVLFVGDLCRGRMSAQGLVLNKRPDVSGVAYERVGICEYDVYNEESKGLTQMIDSGNERGIAKII